MSRLRIFGALSLLLISSSLGAKGPRGPEPGPIPRSEEYCLILARATFGGLGSKVTISVDFGKNPDSKWVDAVVMKHEDGKPVKFKSVIDALNHMNSYGWELMDAFPMSSGQGTDYHYLMRRKIDQDRTGGGEGATAPQER